jgi:hypothetical protein
MELRSSKTLTPAVSVVDKSDEDKERKEKILEAINIFNCGRFFRGTVLPNSFIKFRVQDIDEVYDIMQKQPGSPASCGLEIVGKHTWEKLFRLFWMYGYDIEHETAFLGNPNPIRLFEGKRRFLYGIEIIRCTDLRELLRPVLPFIMRFKFMWWDHDNDVVKQYCCNDYGGETSEIRYLKSRTHWIDNDDNDISESDDESEEDSKGANGLWESVDVEAFNKKIEELEKNFEARLTLLEARVPPSNQEEK